MSTKTSNNSKSQSRKNKKGSKFMVNVKVEEDDEKKEKRKRYSEVISLDDEEDPLNISGIKYQEKHKSQIMQQNYTQTEQIQEPYQSKVYFKCLNSHIQIDENSQLRIAKINYFFKWHEEIYFQIMVGRGQFIYRQPQVMTYNSICQNLEGKLMVYKYIKQRCLAVISENKQLSSLKSDSSRIKIDSNFEPTKEDSISPKKKMT